jgi:hypothetical protein
MGVGADTPDHGNKNTGDGVCCFVLVDDKMCTRILYSRYVRIGVSELYEIIKIFTAQPWAVLTLSAEVCSQDICTYMYSSRPTWW